MQTQELRLYVWGVRHEAFVEIYGFALAYSPTFAKQQIIDAGCPEDNWDRLQLRGQDAWVFDAAVGFSI